MFQEVMPSMGHAVGLKNALHIQVQCFVNLRSILNLIVILFSFPNFLAAFYVQKKHHFAIVLETGGYLPPGNAFIYFRCSSLFVTLYCNIEYIQKNIQIIIMWLEKCHGHVTRSQIKKQNIISLPQIPLLFSSYYFFLQGHPSLATEDFGLFLYFIQIESCNMYFSKNDFFPLFNISFCNHPYFIMGINYNVFIHSTINGYLDNLQSWNHYKYCCYKLSSMVLGF